MNLSQVAANVIGEGIVIETPYGSRRLTYCDHAASGRGYEPIERFLQVAVLPTYGNVHTETSHVGAQTMALREDARRAIKRSSGCGIDDVAIFTGSGATGAIAQLIRALGLELPCVERRQAKARPGRPLVLLGPYEHHSNELPWREADVDVAVVAECQVDGVDLDDLKQKVREAGQRKVIGSFSAASNVTGRITNVGAIATILHNAGGWAFFDFAAAGPYVDIHMSGSPEAPLGYADAAFLSMHKFLGGPGTPGVLLAKKHLFTNAVPTIAGGGTVSYTSPHGHTFLADVEHREEGGTPNVLGSIRAGLAMQLKDFARGEPKEPNLILDHEQRVARRVIEAFASEPKIKVLGDLEAPRLGIVSLLIYTDSGRMLHHNFVVALLNDLFGIQARGGNSCAGPYSHRLLGIDLELSRKMELAVQDGWHGCKPGWTRLSFGWYDSPRTVDFVIDAVRFIAKHGIKFMPDYHFDPKSGTWTHKSFRPELLTLHSPTPEFRRAPESVRGEYIKEALALARRPRRPSSAVPAQACPFEHIRWFELAV